ncbi:hypothetical protein K1T71_014470 [Dendrolimus kikuchii]|uniref:Uncharacterized protein n=1 Tax=Dendrolimus kikuchii TaxID=765133 RepID=A0ACC1CE73_9NEOP|nr:hypothetical protein K1T71_014470 [Dendrolimus kikuchii]
MDYGLPQSSCHHWVYSIRDHIKSADAVNAFMETVVSDDGPCLHKKHKNPNSADQFNEDHQGPYKAREKQSKDDVEAINEHHSTYPKMINELEKRKSIAKPTAITLKRSNEITGFLDYKQSQSKVAVKRLYTRTPAQRYRRKNKPKRNRRRVRFRRKPKARDCQVCSFLKEVGKMYDTYVLTTEMIMAENERRELSRNLSKISRLSVGSGSEVKKSEVSGDQSCNPSVSTYNSFPSIDHEPIVSG